MINNRQNGRRRGRGGVRPPNGAGGGNDRGSRIDNRSRGNAAQLYEKYKALARDSQMQGDRVMTEYYLQFSDHYFRVLNENRSRFEEQNPRRQRDDFDDFEDGDGDGDMADEMSEPAPRYAQEQQGQRRDRYPRQGDEAPGNRQNQAGDRGGDRGGDRESVQRPVGGDPGPEQRGNGEPSPRRDAGDGYRAERPAAEQPAAFTGDAEAPRPRRGRRAYGEGQAEAPRIEVDRLPPAIVPSAPVGDASEAPEAAAEPAAPRRRGRPRRVTGDTPGAPVDV